MTSRSLWKARTLCASPSLRRTQMKLVLCVVYVLPLLSQQYSTTYRLFWKGDAVRVHLPITTINAQEADCVFSVGLKICLEVCLRRVCHGMRLVACMDTFCMHLICSTIVTYVCQACASHSLHRETFASPLHGLSSLGADTSSVHIYEDVFTPTQEVDFT